MKFLGPVADLKDEQSIARGSSTYYYYHPGCFTTAIHHAA